MQKAERSKTTILDVAKESGISKSTISRYLRGDVVSPQKVVMIEQALRNSGYVRNNFAQYMRTKKTDLIGIVVPDLDNPFFTKIIKRLDELTFAKGQSLIIKTSNRSVEREQEVIQYIRGFRVDALFLCRSQLSDSDIQALELDIPVVSIDKSYETIHSVVSNNFDNGFLLTTHMMQQTNAPVAFFLREEESESVLERLRGYESAMLAEHRQAHAYRYDVNHGVDVEALISFLETNHIEGLICRNDNDAVKIMSIMKDYIAIGRIKPLLIAGFDNISIASQITPELTTIDQHIQVMCDTAFELIQAGQTQVVHKVHPSELIIRQSTLMETKR